MIIRDLTPDDIPALRALAEASGYPYPDLTGPHIETVQVVTDSDGNIIMACAAKRLVELYLYVNPALSASVKIQCLQLLHKGVAASLRDNGYNSVEAFLPAEIAAKFGRRLERTFGWFKNWKSWTLRF